MGWEGAWEDARAFALVTGPRGASRCRSIMHSSVAVAELEPATSASSSSGGVAARGRQLLLAAVGGSSEAPPKRRHGARPPSPFVGEFRGLHPRPPLPAVVDNADGPTALRRQWLQLPPLLDASVAVADAEPEASVAVADGGATAPVARRSWSRWPRSMVPGCPRDDINAVADYCAKTLGDVARKPWWETCGRAPLGDFGDYGNRREPPPGEDSSPSYQCWIETPSQEPSPTSPAPDDESM